DLVAEHDVGEDRTGLEDEVLQLAVVDADPGHVGGEQIRGELEAAPLAVDAPGDRLGQHRLADAGHVLDQQVALGGQPDEGETDDLRLAFDDFLDIRGDRLEGLRKSAEVRLRDRHSVTPVGRAGWFRRRPSRRRVKTGQLSSSCSVVPFGRSPQLYVTTSDGSLWFFIGSHPRRFAYSGWNHRSKMV